MSIAKSEISASIDQREVVLDRGGFFSIKLPAERTAANAFLVLDIYDLDKPVHPEGHIGWWRFEIDQLPVQVSGSLVRGEDGGVFPRIYGAAPSDQWRNPAKLDLRRMELLVVMRSSITSAILSIGRVPVMWSDQDLNAFRSRVDRDFLSPRYVRHSRGLSAGRRVHIVSKSIFERDAVGNLCFALYRMLRQQGVPVRLFAVDFDLAMNDIVDRRETLALEVKPDDAILYFFSIHDDKLEELTELNCNCRIAYYHGITPPELLQVFDPELSAKCARALRQLPLLARFDRLATNSVANAAFLRAAFVESGVSAPWEIAVIPPKILSESELQIRRVDRETNPSCRSNLLYVGRIKSHKRIEDLLHLVAQYRMLDPDARCTIIGAADTPAYSDYLNWVQTRQLDLPADAVDWRGSVSDEELARAYAEATVYVSMSEHEGFCLPILEAMMHDIPVFAYDLPAIRELMGTSGVIFAEKSFSGLAHRLHELTKSPDAWMQIEKSQREWVGQLIGKMDGQSFIDLLADAGAPQA